MTESCMQGTLSFPVKSLIYILLSVNVAVKHGENFEVMALAAREILGPNQHC